MRQGYGEKRKASNPLWASLRTQSFRGKEVCRCSLYSIFLPSLHHIRGVLASATFFEFFHHSCKLGHSEWGQTLSTVHTGELIRNELSPILPQPCWNEHCPTPRWVTCTVSSSRQWLLRSQTIFFCPRECSALISWEGEAASLPATGGQGKLLDGGEIGEKMLRQCVQEWFLLSDTTALEAGGCVQP